MKFLICFLSVLFYSFCALGGTPRLLNVPAYLSEDTSIQEVAQNLTKKAKSDKEKAKILAYFLATYYQRDGFIKKEKEKKSRAKKEFQKPYQVDFFRTRVGESFDFATLYQQLCQSVGLKAVVIEGYVGNNIHAFGVVRQEQKAIRQASQLIFKKSDLSLTRYEGAWNAVEIDGNWILVDTYLMIKGDKYSYKNISNKRAMERILDQLKNKRLSVQNKQIDNNYFDADPKMMIKNHFPLNQNWQLLKHPVSWQKFIKN